MSNTPVTQADREAVFELCKTGIVFKGSDSFEPAFEAFARHRLATEVACRAEADRAWEAYRTAHDQATANGAELASCRAREAALIEAAEKVSAGFRVQAGIYGDQIQVLNTEYPPISAFLELATALANIRGDGQ